MQKKSIKFNIIYTIKSLFVFMVSLAIVFAPWTDMAYVYLPEKVANQVAQIVPKTPTASALVAGEVYVFIVVASGSLSGAQSNGSWTVPKDWNPASNSIEVIGAGGSGGDGITSQGAGGGGGGGYSKITNLVFAAASTSIPFSVGASGSGGTGGGDGSDGGHTWFGKTLFGNVSNGCFSAGTSICVSAEGGEGADNLNTTASASGGGTASASGTTKFAGGNGGGGATGGTTPDGNAGGGGAGGPGGNGMHSRAPNGATNTGGSGGGGAGGYSAAKGTTNSSGTGGAGGAGYSGATGGTAGTGNGGAGSIPGAGGGGGGVTTTGNGGAGAAGRQWTTSPDRGSGGGGGGSGDLASMTGGSGGYAGGGGGGGQACVTTACRGEDGLIVIKYTPIAAQTHFQWFNDSYALDSKDNLASISAEDIKASGSEALLVDTTYRLRLQVANTKNNYSGAANFTADKFRLEMTRAGTSCVNGNISSGWRWETVPLSATLASHAFEIATSAQYADGASTSASLLTAPRGDSNTAATFTNGYGLDTRATSGFQTLNENTYTEIEWGLRADSQFANASADYCFRAGWITDASTTPDTRASMSFSKIASASVRFPTTYTQNHYKWYYNIDNVDPTGGLATEDALGEVVDTQPARLRMNLTVGGSALSATTQAFKLKYSTDLSSWTDVGATTSTDTWRFFENPSLAHGTTLTTTKLTGSDVFGDYMASNSMPTNPNAVSIGEDVEYDWSLNPVLAEVQTTYFFRMFKTAAGVDSALDTFSTNPSIRVTRTIPFQGGGDGPGLGGGSGGGAAETGGGQGGGEGAGEGGGSGGGQGQEGGGQGGGSPPGGGGSPVMFLWEWIRKFLKL